VLGSGGRDIEEEAWRQGSSLLRYSLLPVVDKLRTLAELDPETVEVLSLWHG
jgi:hypothetical protein